MTDGVYFHDPHRTEEEEEELDLQLSYGMHFTREQLQDFLRHNHWIPMLRGLTAAYVARTRPGLDYQYVIGELRESGLVVSNGSGMLKVVPGLVELHFNGRSSWAARWADGSLTRAASGKRSSLG